MAGPLFDNLQDSIFNITHTTFGYNASWSPSDGSETQTARVLLNQPSEDDKLQGVNYSKIMHQLEYKYFDFVGMKESVDAHGDELLTVHGVGDFNVRQVRKHFDGKTMKAILVKA